MSNQRITDLSYLNDICAGDRELISEMIRLFLEDAPIAIDKMSKLNDQQEWELIAAEAHKLKPNLSYMGLEESRKMIVELEGYAKKAEETEKIGPLISKIKDRCDRAYAELREELE